MRMKIAGVGLVMMLRLSVVDGFAQEPPAPPPPRDEARANVGAAIAKARTDAVVSVATNPVVAAELGLTPGQLAALGAGLDPEKAQAALEAQRLAEAVVILLTDTQIAADLQIAPAQQLLIEEKMTAALIRKAFTTEQIQSLSRAAGGAGAMRASMESFRDRMMQRFDANGDGQLSDEERRAAFEEWRQRRGGPGGPGGTGRSPRDGGQGRGPRDGGVRPEGGQPPAGGGETFNW